MRLPIEAKKIISDKPLSNNATTLISSEFPLTGETWSKIRLIFKIALTNSSGSGGVSLGGWNYIKNILFRTEADEELINLPGRALYLLNYRNNFAEPAYDPIPSGANTGTYYVICDLPFHLNYLARPEDLYFYSARYKYVELQIQTGTISDFMTVPGSSQVSTYLDIVLYKTRSSLDKSPTALPEVCPYFKRYASINPAQIPYFQIENSPDMAVMDLIMFNGTSPVAAFNATPADNITDISFKDNFFNFLDSVPFTAFRAERKRLFGADLVGVYPHSFIIAGSTRHAYPTGGGRTDIRLEIGKVMAGTNQTDLMIVGFRRFR